MRFNQDDYLAAFPREERAAAQSTPATDQPGSVTEEADKITIKEPAPEPDPTPDDLGGGEDGNE